MLSTPYGPQLSPSHAVAPICLERKPRPPLMVASPLSSPSLFGSSWDEEACSSPRASLSPALSPRSVRSPTSCSSPDAFDAKHHARWQGAEECADTYIGIQIERDLLNGVTTIHQADFIEKVLARFGMQDSNPVYTPLQTSLLQADSPLVADPPLLRTMPSSSPAKSPSLPSSSPAKSPSQLGSSWDEEGHRT